MLKLTPLQFSLRGFPSRARERPCTSERPWSSRLLWCAPKQGQLLQLHYWYFYCSCWGHVHVLVQHRQLRPTQLPRHLHIPWRHTSELHRCPAWCVPRSCNRFDVYSSQNRKQSVVREAQRIWVAARCWLVQFWRNSDQSRCIVENCITYILTGIMEALDVCTWRMDAWKKYCYQGKHVFWWCLFVRILRKIYSRTYINITLTCHLNCYYC